MTKAAQAAFLCAEFKACSRHPTICRTCLMALSLIRPTCYYAHLRITTYRRKKRRFSASFFRNIGTEDGTRTHKPVRALPPQGSVSTNSTTSAQILLLARDIAGRLSRSSWLSLLGFRRCTQIFPLTSFIGLIAVHVTQHQTDNEEQGS